jgi:prevent-host-death family protein
MQEIGAFEAKNTLGSLLDRVERGEEIVITRHGKPVARLISSNDDRRGQQQAKAAAERIRARARSLGQSAHWASLKADRDRGRP